MHSRRWTAYGKIPIETGEEWGRQSSPHTDGQPEMGTVLMQGGWRGSFSDLLNLRLDLQILRKDFTNPGAPSDDSAFQHFGPSVPSVVLLVMCTSAHQGPGVDNGWCWHMCGCFSQGWRNSELFPHHPLPSFCTGSG